MPLQRAGGFKKFTGGKRKASNGGSSSFKRSRSLMVSNALIKRKIVDMHPTKFYLRTTQNGDCNQSLFTLVGTPGIVPFPATEVENTHSREGYKIRAMGVQLNIECLVSALSTQDTFVRLILVKGMRAGNLSANDVPWTQTGVLYTDQTLFVPNQKQVSVMWDSGPLHLQKQAAGATNPSQIQFTKFVKINETWRYPSMDPALQPQPIGPGGLYLYAISNQPIGQGPKVDVNHRLSFKDQ